MKTASVKEIKDELGRLTQQELLNLCVRLVKFKKESKEFASYLLFNAHDEPSYVAGVQEILGELFSEVNTKNFYIAKKNLRKIIRTANRYIKYSAQKTTEIEVLIFICTKMQALKIDYKKSVQLQNLYTAQIKKIHAAVKELHEDLQYDYLREIKQL